MDGESGNEEKGGWEAEEGGGEGVLGGGHAKGQLLVRGFYWECRREGVCVKDHRLRF